MDLLERLNMPPCKKTRVPVKALEEQLEADSKQKKMLTKHIASMHLVSLINEQTARIRAYTDENYSFQAIYVFEIELKASDQLTEFTELVHSAFPESTLLILKYRGTIYLSGARKRINKQDSTKTVIEDLIWAEVSNDFMAWNIKENNLKEYYESLINILYRYKVMNVTGVLPAGNGEYKRFIKQYEKLMTQINKLKGDYSAASMRNERLRIDDDLFLKEKELEQLIRKIKGEQ